MAPGDALFALRGAQSLRSLRLARSDVEAASPAHAAVVLEGMLSCGSGDFLRSIEGRPVPDAVRANALVRAGRLAAGDAAAYRVHASAARTTAPLDALCFAPAALAPGGPQCVRERRTLRAHSANAYLNAHRYAAGDVRALLCLDRCGYTEANLPPLAPFVGLRALHLAGNKLKSLASLHLEALAALEDLDVRDNALACSIAELGALLQVQLRSYRLGCVAGAARSRECAGAVGTTRVRVPWEPRLQSTAEGTRRAHRGGAAHARRRLRPAVCGHGGHARGARRGRRCRRRQ